MPTLENQTTFRKKAIDGPNSKEQAWNGPTFASTITGIFCNCDKNL